MFRAYSLPWDRGRQLTPFAGHSRVEVYRLWASTRSRLASFGRKTAPDIYLVTRLYSEALNTMVILRKSGAEEQAQIRVRVQHAGTGQTIPGFSPAQDDEKF